MAISDLVIPTKRSGWMMASGKRYFDLSAAQKIGALNPFDGPRQRSGPGITAEREMCNQIDAHWFRQPMKEWHPEVRLERKPEIRHLDVVPRSKPTAFGGKGDHI